MNYRYLSQSANSILNAYVDLSIGARGLGTLVNVYVDLVDHFKYSVCAWRFM